MTAPTQRVRLLTYNRDNNRCADCGTTSAKSWQHRESSGQGGRGKKAPLLTPADGVTLCLPCNQACEASGQATALRMGWKLRRNRGSIPACQVPFFVRWCGEWWLPDVTGGKQVVDEVTARELVAVAGGIPGDGTIY